MTRAMRSILTYLIIAFSIIASGMCSFLVGILLPWPSNLVGAICIVASTLLLALALVWIFEALGDDHKEVGKGVL